MYVYVSVFHVCIILPDLVVKSIIQLCITIRGHIL